MDKLTGRVRASVGSRATRLSPLFACGLGLLAACSPQEADQPQIIQPPATVDSSTAVTSPITSDAATSPAPGAAQGTPSLDAGAKSDATVQPPVTQPDTSVPNSAPDAGAPDATATPDGSAPTGPLPLPDPTMMGPYKIFEVDNVGKGFENPIDASDQGMGGIFCTIFVSGFTSDQMVIDQYSKVPAEYKMDLYTLYYPEGAPGQRFPVLSWANGTCAHTVGYADMIKHIVSHGFIVIAPHSRFTGSGAAQKRGIDWVLMQDTVADSPLFGRVNKDLVGVFGHSQGGGSTGIASGDPRVKTSVLMHGGNSNMLHAPALFLTGDGDLNPSGVRAQYDSARGAAAFGSLKMSNHVTMMEHAERMAPEVLAWFRYQLLGDEVAKKWYVGADCVLCKDSEWVYAQKMLK